ncbi:DUF1212 domain membrane protein [Penicillium lividum]|nr:DUF1212 domain membrane protein [Penicillium lividum]
MDPTRPIGWESQSSHISHRDVANPASELTNSHDEQPDMPRQNRSPRDQSPSHLHQGNFGSNSRCEHGNLAGENTAMSTTPPSDQPPPSESSQGQKNPDYFEKSSELEPGFREALPESEKKPGYSILRKGKALVARLLPPSSTCEVESAAANRHASVSGDAEAGNIPASLEAHQLVREIVYDQPDQQAAVPQSEQAMEYGVQRRESEGGVLSNLLKLYGSLDAPQNTHSQSDELPSVRPSNTPIGARTPSKVIPWRQKAMWLGKQRGTPTDTMQDGISPGETSPAVFKERLDVTPKRKSEKTDRRIRLEDEIRITVHIADILSRQKYIIQLCKALMMFGAPMHRLEEHMQMTASVLEMECQFLYVPGCMIMSFDDPTTRTTEVKLVRVAQGINLGLLADTHDVYKNVVHDVMGADEATSELQRITNSKARYNKWIIVVVYGIASAMVGPFAFNARPIDMPIIFFNGALLGILQHVIAPRSVLYSNVFEVTASVLTSFIARGLGSIEYTKSDGNREYLFCFSAVAQSSVALILPGYTVLSSSLELQSHQLVAGSIRMVYAIIYSLFLGYGITVGTTIYGLIDPGATSAITCPSTGIWGNEYAQRFPFVAAFVLCLLVVNQGRWKQAPVMLFIAEAGYIVTYFVTQRIGTSSQVANTVGAFTIGVMGNLYSRMWHGHAATSILPGIFVLVPSGLAASGPLISGIKSADETRNNISSAINHTSYTVYSVESSQLYTADLGFGMVEVSIGITVGLFIAALLIYPFGKRRSGLFSF